MNDNWMNILDILACPYCNKNKFEVINLQSKDTVDDKVLICRYCANIFISQNGIISLLRAELCDIERESAFLERYKGKLPQISVERRLDSIERARSINDEKDWVLSEKYFWDKKKYSDTIFVVPEYNWNRYNVRNKHLLRYLKNKVRATTILDIGCGRASTVYHHLNPQELGYTLVCADISFNALLKAQKIHPGALFVQCDAGKLPFTSGTLDVILEFGTLHHLPQKDNALVSHLSCLKDGGYLAFHEPINRRRALLSSYKFFAKMTSEQSDHNEWIDEQRTLRLLEKHGKIINKHLEYSPLRSWLVHFFINRLSWNNKYIHFMNVTIDQFVIHSVGRLWNRMDGNSLLVLFQKSGN